MLGVRGRLSRALGAGLVLVLAARLCSLVLRYQGPAGAVRRPHIESAALLLAVSGLIVRFACDAKDSNRIASATASAALWLALVAGALALYWPALHLGLLSDDFILFQHALGWDVSQVAPQLFRPLPLFVWAVVLHLGGGPAALHLLNILLHGTNAYLSGRVVAGWVSGRWWPSMAAVLVLTAPLGPEAVAWCAGTFDLFATMWTLLAILVARRADPTARHRILLIAASSAALLSKETAVMLPMLLLIDGAVRRAFTRRSIVDIGLVTAAAVVFAALRIQSATTVEISGFSRYRVQRVLFDSFGTLAAPWHVSDPWPSVIRAGYAICVIVLIAVFFVSRGTRVASRAFAGGTGVVLAPILPLVAFFYIGPQLEGSRYLYLAACGWAAMLVTAAADLAWRGPRSEAAVRALVFMVIGAGIWGVREHLRPWTHAAQTRDLVLRTAAGDERLRACSVAYIEGLPDSVDGAYLFANGAREALADVGVNAFARADSGDCSFRWDPAAARFIAPGGTAR
jgi:hypothetical protein